MKPDVYTKAVLTIIAVLLAIIALKPLVSPDTIATARGSLEKVRNGRGSISILLSAYRKK
jgi:hypothetical protein